MHNILHNHPGQAMVPLVDASGDEELTVPREAAELLVRVLTSLAQGQPVMLLPDHAELTTQQAADLLGVSRPHLIKLLDSAAIDYRRVGSHRRIDAASLRAYRDA
ncbi:MAG: helix-turn-helix domain-containing protein, partial [Allobranchiibius sp.]